MSTYLHSNARRLFFALAFSVLLHALFLWLPGATLPRMEIPLPLLSAKLIPLPKAPSKPVRRAPENKHISSPPSVPDKPIFPVKQPEAPQSSVAAEAALAASAIPAEAAQAASAVSAETALAASAVSGGVMAASAVPPAANYALTSDHAPPLPKHARLRFVAQLGAHGLHIGAVSHELEIKDGRYTLHAELQTTGLASLLKRYQNIQDSSGTVSIPGGLRPDQFTEAKTDSGGTQRSEASFDWNTHQIGFMAGEKKPLPDGAQDILGFLYQLSQLPFRQEVIPLAISNGRKLEYYELEVGSEELIETPMGKLRALHLRKIHKPGEEGLEIWLATEYRLFPVKVQQIERDGKVAGEILITEIRVSDE